jgi:hypothetical protein
MEKIIGYDKTFSRIMTVINLATGPDQYQVRRGTLYRLSSRAHA